ncbi:hypothetical protein EVAR_70966_1 [Eumeta japonica]|uniref:Uncharacterized protein n=1 Tax=Eumeta variegata TaxID=151549 RepID=A0A4C1SL21_EUMVA|nr:hypothetical protein EVAR_70966_1 [Eumeta japonica]
MYRSERRDTTPHRIQTWSNSFLCYFMSPQNYCGPFPPSEILFVSKSSGGSLLPSSYFPFDQPVQPSIPYSIPTEKIGNALKWQFFLSETSNVTFNKVALNVQRSWGGRKRQSESECRAIERMRVVYLLQASASVSNE